MRFKTLVTALVIASLGASSMAFAQPERPGWRPDARDGRQDSRHDNRDNQRDWQRARDQQRDARRDAQRQWQHDREVRRETYYYNARSPEFRRGGHLPPQLRSRTYVVNDWRVHRLPAPPRGYQWVQVGPDYVLAAIATGLILNLILSQ